MSDADRTAPEGNKRRRLLAVMFTDVVGYTALMQRDEDAARTVRRRHRQAVDAAVSAHGGDLLQYLGDGSFTMFPSVADAVRAGIEVQRGLRQDPVVPLRVGIHQGDISYDTQGAYGDCVNVASRIQGLATAGSILISAKAQDEIKNRPDLSTTPLGDFPLKNVGDALAVCAVVSDGLAIPTRRDVLDGIRSAPAAPSDAITRLNAALEGRYHIEREVGEGGMATVYLADDLRHERSVAIKVLKPELAAVVGGERFLREIKTTASLQHPHILGLHDSGEADGFLFFVMPLVGGASLREHLDDRRQLGVDEAVRIATQVAEALDYAHRQGLLHRDIKPENILLQDGQAVVADFGIALAVSAASGARLTETGMSMGTPHYMSPEQASGDRELSPESDIYSLGCVLYEMLAGDPPHLGSTAQSILAKIFNEPPTPVSVFRDTVPASVEAATLRALEKTPADRYRSAGGFIEALAVHGDPISDSGHAATPIWSTPITSRSPSGVRLVRYVGVALGSIAAGAAVALGVAAFADTGEARTGSAPSHRQVTFEGDASDAAISPDGASVVYVTGRSGEHQRLMLADLAGGPAIEILSGRSVLLPTWSPDGSAIVVSALRNRPPPLQAYRVSRLGGEPQHLGPGGYTTWSADGSRIASALGDQRGFWIVSESTGESEKIALEGYRFTQGLSWSPTADRLAILTSGTESGLNEVFTVDPTGHDRIPVMALRDPLSSPRWAPSGDALYILRHRNNLADLLRVDRTEAGDAWSEPEVVLSGLQATDAFNSTFNLTADGRTLTYGTRQVYTHLWITELEGDGAGQVRDQTQLTGGTSLIERPSISPDGQWIAYSAQTSAGANIFKMPITGGDPVQLTFSEAYQTSPAWAPDGESIAFAARDTAGARVWVMRSDGTAPTEFPQTDVSAGGLRVVWAPGDRLLYQRPGNQNFYYLDVVTG